MFNKLIRFIRRPDINEQNTGHYAFQKYNGPAYAGVNGNGGQGVRRTINALSPGTIVPGNSLVKLDPTATGNPAFSPIVQPLSDADTSSF